MAEVLDDKSRHCIPFILDCVNAHRKSFTDAGKPPPPFFVGLNGVQGAGKTTLVKALHQALTSESWNLPTVILSIDDLYLPYLEQRALADAHPRNPLIQHRGQPSTHDVNLGIDLFEALLQRRRNIKIPAYDKSAFSGQGDRLPVQTWETVNLEGQPTVDVVIFEGWCVGFRALSEESLKEKWASARQEFERRGDIYKGQLGKHDLENVAFINMKLKHYDALTNHLQAFIHIDADDTLFVYKWRLQQEAALRESKGNGMSDEQVVDFVNGYYPAYELYSDTLREGAYTDHTQGQQLRLVVDKNRRVIKVERI